MSILHFTTILLLAPTVIASLPYNYPTNFYSKSSFSDDSSHIVYGNYVGHCHHSPSYNLKYNDKYFVYGSSPIIVDNSSPNEVPSAITSHCTITLVGPIGWYLNVKFSDRRCSEWPVGSSLKIFEGKTVSKRQLLSLSPAKINTKLCSEELTSSSNTITISIKSAFASSFLSPYFNFTLSVVPTDDKQVGKKSSFTRYSYASFISVGVFIAIIIVSTRVFCRRSGPYYLCSCCCTNRERPNHIAGIHQIYAISNTSHRNDPSVGNNGIPQAVIAVYANDNNTGLNGQHSPINGQGRYFKPPDVLDQPPPPYDYTKYTTVPPQTSTATAGSSNTNHPSSSGQLGVSAQESYRELPENSSPPPPTYEQSVQNQQQS